MRRYLNEGDRQESESLIQNGGRAAEKFMNESLKKASEYPALSHSCGLAPLKMYGEQQWNMAVLQSPYSALPEGMKFTLVVFFM